MQKITLYILSIWIPKRNKPNEEKWVLNTNPGTELLCFAKLYAMLELFFQKEKLKSNSAANKERKK